MHSTMSFGAHRAASALRVLGSSSGSGGGVVAAVWTSLVTPFAAGPAVAGAFVAPNSRQLTVACVAGGAVARSQRRGRAAPRRSPLPQPSPPRPLADAQEVFFAESVQSFEDLGVSSPVAAALSAAGFARPSRVQELALPDILAGRDLVLAAETGSGKTLAYIAPLATLLLQRKEQKRLQAREHGDGAGTSHGRRRSVELAPLVLVLCPNIALCQQVVRSVNALLSPDGRQLLRAAQVSSSAPPPIEPPDVVVATPGGLAALFDDRGRSYGSAWTAEGVSAAAEYVVVDEADLLSQGGYAKHMLRLLEAFKAGERRLVEAQTAQELGMDLEEVTRLPRHLRQACWEGGAPALLAAGYKPQQQQQQLARTPGPQAASAAPYFKRQYVFVAATMPSLTKADVGVELAKRFKDASWVSGDLLHRVKPHVTHEWARIEPGAEADALLVQAVRDDPQYQAGSARVLVFARDAASATRTTEVLQAGGIETLLYHKQLPREHCDAVLAAMSSPSSRSSSPAGSLVMVSTDAASRGLDLPGVTHVVQADFAATATEFLHRVGRTARAGAPGRITSFYAPNDAVLAEALRGYVEAGEPLEACFSRNRSFSRKVKRYGGFVPRGEEGTRPAGGSSSGGGTS